MSKKKLNIEKEDIIFGFTTEIEVIYGKHARKIPGNIIDDNYTFGVKIPSNTYKNAVIMNNIMIQRELPEELIDKVRDYIDLLLNRYVSEITRNS
jgi:hypothetical protein